MGIAEFVARQAVLALERAVQAIRFGLAMKSPGYNIFVTGQEGTGKTTMADHMVVATGTSQRHLAAMAEKLIQRLKEAGHADVRAELDALAAVESVHPIASVTIDSDGPVDREALLEGPTY